MSASSHAAGGLPDRAPVRVMLVDDHPILRLALRNILNDWPNIVVAGECADGRTAVEETIRILPDVVLMDLNLPGLDGIDATRQIRARAPGVRVLLLSGYGNRENVRDSLAAGASGFVIKRSDIDELAEALETVRDGGTYFSRDLAKSIDVDSLLSEVNLPQGTPPSPQLSLRELEILSLICRGLSTREIASHLSISPKTAESHSTNIMTKVGVGNRVQLVRFALDTGLLRTFGPEDED